MANNLEVAGWVKNEPDGSIRIVAEGEKNKLRKLAEWCKKGTKDSKIENVEIEWGKSNIEFNDFKIR